MVRRYRPGAPIRDAALAAPGAETPPLKLRRLLGSVLAGTLPVRGAGLLVVWPLFWCETARAQTSLHATAQATLGHSDNVLGTPSNPPAGTSPAQSSVFVLLSPGAVLYHDRPTARYAATYRRTFAYYLAIPENNNASDALQFQGTFDLTPVDTLNLSLGATLSSFALLALESTGSNASIPQVDGDNNAFGLTFFQGWTHQFSEDWSNSQGTTIGVVIPIDSVQPQPWAYHFGLQDAVQFSHKRDAHSLQAGVNTLFTSFIDDPLSSQQENQIYVGTLGYGWRRDLSPTWSSYASAGGNMQMDKHKNIAAGPLASVAMSYHHLGHTASLSISRAPNVSLAAARLYFSDQAALNASTLLSEDLNITANAFGTLGINRALTPTGDTESINVATVGARLGWNPGPVQVNLAYQYFRQFNESNNSTTLRDMERNIVTLSVGGMYPDRQMAPIPMHGAVRVDQADLAAAP